MRAANYLATFTFYASDGVQVVSHRTGLKWVGLKGNAE